MSSAIVPSRSAMGRVQTYNLVEPQSPTPLESGLLGFGLGGVSVLLLLRRQIDQLHATIEGWQTYANRLANENSDLHCELWRTQIELMAARAKADRFDQENARLRQRNEALEAERIASLAASST